MDLSKRRCFAILILIVVAAGMPLAAARSFQGTLRPPTTAALVDLYGKGDYAAFDSALLRITDFGDVIDQVRTFKYPWADAGHHRQATFALEIAAAALAGDGFSHWQTHSNFRFLLENAANSIKTDALASDFERHWRLAEVALLEGNLRPQLAQGFVDDARKRIPDEARFVLAEGIIADQQTRGLTVYTAEPPTPIDKQYFNAGFGVAATALEAFAESKKWAPVAAETNVRVAWLDHRLGKDAEALPLLESVDGTDPDRTVVYLDWLFRGHVLEALHRTPEAEAAYGMALRVMPPAQAPQVALLTSLARRGAWPAARALADATATTPATGSDPWRSYWQGDYRVFGSLLALLRKEVK